MAPNGLKWAKNDPKWLKNGPKMKFRYLGDLPGTKKGPKMRKMTQKDLLWPQMTWNGPKMGQKWLKMAQKWPKKKPRSEIAKKMQPAFFNFWHRGTVSEISAKKRNFADFGRFPPQKGKYTYFSIFFAETRLDFPGHQKNDPDLQRRRTLKRERRNGRFSVGPKIAKWAKNDSKWPKNGPKKKPRSEIAKKTAARFLQFLR